MVGVASGKLHLSWYGAAWGPDCADFSINLLKTLEQPGINDVVTFEFYPVGGFTNPGINKSVECPSTQKGANFDLPDKDCQSDKYEACLMNVSGCADYTCPAKKQIGLSKFLACFEGKDGSAPKDADGC